VYLFGRCKVAVCALGESEGKARSSVCGGPCAFRILRDNAAELQQLSKRRFRVERDIMTSPRGAVATEIITDHPFALFTTRVKARDAQTACMTYDMQ
jgi:hypothetical protein